MKVTYAMIDKQLRLRGLIFNLFFRRSSEGKFLKLMHSAKKFSEKAKGRRRINGIHSSEEWITREDGSKLRVCIYRPLHKVTNAPGVLWLHGGGYALGIPEFFLSTFKKLIEASDCIIIAPDYRLSIETPYPAALEDAYAALKWMKSHAQNLGIRPDQLMVGGESAGGGLTAALCLYARDKDEVKIAFQMPLYPMIDDRMITESSKENNAPVLNSRMNAWAWKLYLGELYGKDVPYYAAPARAADYRNLPPAVTFVGDLEPFRDETIQYVENLRKAGVPVDFKVYSGCYHGFDIINPKADVSKNAAAFFIDSFKYAVNHYFIEQNIPV